MIFLLYDLKQQALLIIHACFSIIHLFNKQNYCEFYYYLQEARNSKAVLLKWFQNPIAQLAIFKRFVHL